MEQCWAAEPSERPLLGYVQPQLEAIYLEAANGGESEGKCLLLSCSPEPPPTLAHLEHSSTIYNDYYNYNFREF